MCYYIILKFISSKMIKAEQKLCSNLVWNFDYIDEFHPTLIMQEI